MADKNKMFFGTNKDTYIAADDAGNIILQTEHGSRTVLDTEGIKVGVGGAEPTVLQAGGGAGAAAVNEFPEIWLEEVDGDGTKIPINPLQGFAAETFDGGYDFASKLVMPFQMDGGSFEKTVKYTKFGSQNVPQITFNFPTSVMLHLDPYSGEEAKEYDLYIDYKDTIAGISIEGPNPYDPDYVYQMSNGTPKLRSINAINAVVVNGESAGIVMCPFNIDSIGSHSYAYGFTPSVDIAGEDLFSSYNIAPNTVAYDLQISLTTETLSRLRAVEGGFIYVNGPGTVDMSNLTHAKNLNIAVYNDPYAANPAVAPGSIIIGPQEGEEFFFENINISNTEISSITLPTNGKFAGWGYNQSNITINNNPNIGEETLNGLIAFLETVAPKLVLNQSISVTWSNNGFNPNWISDPYALKPDNVEALVNNYPIYFSGEEEI